MSLHIFRRRAIRGKRRDARRFASAIRSDVIIDRAAGQSASYDDYEEYCLAHITITFLSRAENDRSTRVQISACDFTFEGPIGQPENVQPV